MFKRNFSYYRMYALNINVAEKRSECTIIVVDYRLLKVREAESFF